MWTYDEENQTYINIINSFVERIGSRYPTKILVDNEIEDLSGQYINGFYSSPGKYSEISAYSSITNIYHPFVLNYLIKCEEEKNPTSNTKLYFVGKNNFEFYYKYESDEINIYFKIKMFPTVDEPYQDNDNDFSYQETYLIREIKLIINDFEKK